MSGQGIHSNLRMRLLKDSIPKNGVKELWRCHFNPWQGISYLSIEDEKHSVMVKDSLANAKISGYTSIRDILPTVVVSCNQTFPGKTDIVWFDFQRTPLKNHLVERAAQAYIMAASTASCCRQLLTNKRQNSLAGKFWSNLFDDIDCFVRKRTHWHPKYVWRNFLSGLNRLFCLWR